MNKFYNWEKKEDLKQIYQFGISDVGGFEKNVKFKTEIGEDKP